MRKKNNTIIIICAIIIGIIYVFFPVIVIYGGLAFLSRGARKIDKMAKINSINYVKNKYHINAKILENQPNMNCGPIGCSNTGYSLVKMKYGKKIFNVYINNKKKTSKNGRDDYQKKQIINKIMRTLKKETNKTPKNYNIDFQDGIYIDNKKYKGFFQKYFDGNNIKDVISNKDKIIIEANYIGEKRFDNINLDNVYNALGEKTNIKLLNYKTNEDYQNSKNLDCFYILDRCSVYLDDALISRGRDKVERPKYDLIKTDDGIKFLVTVDDYYGSTWKRNLNINVNKIDYEWHPRNHISDVNTISDRLIIGNYLINVEGQANLNSGYYLYLFVPKEKTENTKHYNMYMNIGPYDVANSNVYYYKTNDYLIFTEQFEELADKKIIVSLEKSPQQ